MDALTRSPPQVKGDCMEFEELFDKFAKYDDTMFSMKGMAEYFYKAGREDTDKAFIENIQEIAKHDGLVIVKPTYDNIGYMFYAIPYDVQMKIKRILET